MATNGEARSAGRQAGVEDAEALRDVGIALHDVRLPGADFSSHGGRTERALVASSGFDRVRARARLVDRRRADADGRVTSRRGVGVLGAITQAGLHVRLEAQGEINAAEVRRGVDQLVGHVFAGLRSERVVQQRVLGAAVSVHVANPTANDVERGSAPVTGVEQAERTVRGADRQAASDRRADVDALTTNLHRVRSGTVLVLAVIELTQFDQRAVFEALVALAVEAEIQTHRGHDVGGVQLASVTGASGTAVGTSGDSRVDLTLHIDGNGASFGSSAASGAKEARRGDGRVQSLSVSRNGQTQTRNGRSGQHDLTHVILQKLPYTGKLRASPRLPVTPGSRAKHGDILAEAI